MRGILIDVHNREIREVSVREEGFLEDNYMFLKCDLIEQACVFAEHDDDSIDICMVDEEGLLKGPTRFFRVKLGNVPFRDFDSSNFTYAGNGLITGMTIDGESTDAKISIKDVRKMILWGEFTDNKHLVFTPAEEGKNEL